MRNILFLTAAICLLSCDPDRIYEKNEEFANGVWHVDSIPEFRFEIPVEGEYDMLMNIRNTLSYPYQNLYVRYSLEDTTGRTIASDLENFQLFDAKTGAPFGDGGIGDIFGHQILILDNYGFQQNHYILKVQHYMRTDSLTNILAVGIRIEENNVVE